MIMTSEKINSLISISGTDTSGKWLSIDHANTFAELIIKECIAAVENTNKHHVHTTFDEMLVNTTIIKTKQSILEHFGLNHDNSK